jgi:hypothetical protein
MISASQNSPEYRTKFESVKIQIFFLKDNNNIYLTFLDHSSLPFFLNRFVTSDAIIIITFVSIIILRSKWKKITDY